MTKEIELKFTYKGDEFQRLFKNEYGYIYRRVNGVKKYYEVFEIRTVETLIDFEKKIGSGEFKHKYPKDNDFGSWAFCCTSLEKAKEYLDSFTIKNK